ncbi:multidrug ABC transporter ATP-binding protein [Sulfolobales archaeon HS-7]|nr:multidrug ABC transporter ATP-binding protein [Sulfolobales archaeon HS-7]
MIREFGSLIVMQFKTIRAYLPAFIFFSFFFPIGLLLMLGSISAPTSYTFIISGTVTFYIAIGTITSVAQTLAAEREAGRISLIVASGIPREIYVISVVLSNGVSTLIIVPLFILIGVIFFHVVIKSVLFLVLALISSTFMGSMMGMDLAFALRNTVAVNQYSSIISFVLSFFAPVYYPPSIIPIPYRYLTFIEPTTYVSQAINYSFSGSFESLMWVGGIVAFTIIFLYIGRRLMERM